MWVNCPSASNVAVRCWTQRRLFLAGRSPKGAIHKKGPVALNRGQHPQFNKQLKNREHIETDWPTSALGQKRPGRASSTSGQVRYVAESGSKFRALRADGNDRRRLSRPAASLPIVPSPLVVFETGQGGEGRV